MEWSYERRNYNGVRNLIGSDVNPAPAEEKPLHKCPYCVDDGPEGNPCLQHLPVIFGKSTTTASDDMKDRFPINYDWKYVGGPLITNDRRKGERRKTGYFRFRPPGDVWRWFTEGCSTINGTDCAADRRSGKNRRKS